MHDNFSITGADPGTEQTEAGASPPFPERRSIARQAQLFRAAKLIAGENEYLCIVRDVSSAGVRVRVFHPIPQTGNHFVETGSGERFPVNLIWCDDGHAGFRFIEDIDTNWLIDETSGPFARRQLRINFNLKVSIQSGGEAHEAVFQNISQQGACIESDRALLISETIRIETPAFPPIYAKVRWRRAPLYGLVFEQTFRLDELALLLASQNTR